MEGRVSTTNKRGHRGKDTSKAIGTLRLRSADEPPIQSKYQPNFALTLEVVRAFCCSFPGRTRGVYRLEIHRRANDNPGASADIWCRDEPTDVVVAHIGGHGLLILAPSLHHSHRLYTSSLSNHSAELVCPLFLVHSVPLPS